MPEPQQRPTAIGPRVAWLLFLPACLLGLVAWWLPMLVISVYGLGLLIGQADTYRHTDWMDEQDAAGWP